MTLFACFLLVLHSWMNIASEILRHGDRKFYEDWWTCSNFEEYYRKWNLIVHEWIYYYLYSDLRRFTLGKVSKIFCKLMVFLVSVLIHEVILTMAFGFFYPVVSFFFGGPGILFTFIKKKGVFYNIIFWMELLFGPGLIVVLYLWEFNLQNAFVHIQYSKAYHKYIPKIFLMFFEEYKIKLISDI